MWVLDVVAGDGTDTTFYLVAGEWSVGRKRCHFNFHADSSISRTHALIRVGALTPQQLMDPSTRPALELVDQKSRFGSFVNQEQIFGTRRLRHGDQISFGAKKTVLRLNDACQRIGMHLIVAESKDATHCIMDPGRIVATVKVLWALVYNQPVVCTPWIYAILNRSSLSEPLPRCEEFLPSDPSIPSVESNYLPNPLRKTLFQGYVVVFLTPQSMQELIAAMGGVVIAAYEGFEEDDALVQELDSQASKHEDDDVKSAEGDQDSESLEDANDVNAADVTIKESSEQMTDPHYESGVVPKEEDDTSSWMSARVLSPREVKYEEDDIGKPLVVSCDLVVKRRKPTRQGRTGGNGLMNYKRFKKGNGCGARSATASLFPQQTVVSVVDNAEREALQENLEAMEAQERIAEELFAMGEGRTTKRLF
uniref:FHA domain-containing protein n=1 Tax=Phytophthora ramorum TaxID=164328 RepID=H3HDB4_PHYRM